MQESVGSKNKILVSKQSNSMRNEISYSVRDLQAGPCFMASYVIYIILMIYLTAAFISRIQITARKELTESYTDFPQGCSAFA